MQGLPTDGSRVHVRLWYRVSRVWSYFDAEYDAVHYEPTMTHPAPGSTLQGTSQVFGSIPGGESLTERWLYARSSPLGNDDYDSGSIEANTTSTTVVGLPADGSTVHVTLWYRVNGLWRFGEFTYTASSL